MQYNILVYLSNSKGISPFKNHDVIDIIHVIIVIILDTVMPVFVWSVLWSGFIFIPPFIGFMFGVYRVTGLHQKMHCAL